MATLVLDSGDTAWIIVATALVMLMTPGLALFYGGMVRAKNVLHTLMACFAILAIVTLQWVIVGYTLAFGGDISGFIGNLDHAFLRGVDLTAPIGEMTIPAGVFILFQMMFAIITPALIFGAMAERVSFKGIVVFTVLWTTLVYDPIAHWVWGGGFLSKLGALDFAGGLVVHVSSGVAALAAALYMGKRKGHGSERMSPHSIVLTVLGAGLLWFGWFGFNAGSALAANGLAAHAFLVTQLAAAAAVVTWVGVEWFVKGKPSVMGAATGAIAGLVAVTPAAGFVGVGGALALGGVAGALCYGGVLLKSRLGYDDALDAFGVHGIGGLWGALGTGLFASVAVGGTAGTLAGGGLAPVWAQAVSIAVVVAFTFAVTWVILVVTDRLVGLRVPENDEDVGLDLALHGESGYEFDVALPPAGGKPADGVAVGSTVLGAVVGGVTRERRD